MSDGMTAAIVCVVAFIVGGIVGGYLVGVGWRNCVIEHGAAEWRCDPKTGGKEFHWKEQTNE